MRKLFLILGLVFCVLLFGCLQPYSEGVNITKKTGCAYSEPPCDENHSCINNTCVLKPGCAYDNPPCSQDEDCINNTCMLKPGCAYDNPPCSQDYECIDNTCIEKTICGKFGCQQGEKDTCCQDCGCAVGEVCDSSGICLVNGTDVVVLNMTTNSIPSTVLHALPPKTIEKSLGPLAQLTLMNRGTLKVYNVNVKSEVQGFGGTMLHELGTLDPKQVITFNISQNINDNALDLANGTTTKLKIILEYKGAGETYTKSIGENVWLSDRNTIDWLFPESAVAWIDPSDQSIINLAKDATLEADIKLDEDRERAARQVYGHMQAYGLKHTGGSGICYSDSLSFPAETLKAKNGDCAELSVLFASLLEAAGVKSILMKSNDTVLSGWTKADGSFVPVDLRGIEDQDFTAAINDGKAEQDKGAALIYPKESTIGIKRVNPGIDVLGPVIITTSANCVLLQDEFRVNFWFENKGYETGRRCLKAVLDDRNEEYFSKRVCVDIYKFDKRNVTFSIDIPKSRSFTKRCFVD